MVCLKCIQNALPFVDISTPLSHSCLTSSVERKNFLSQLNSFVTNNSNDIIGGGVNCKYYSSCDFNSHNFNSMCFSIFHLNITSLSKHFNELNSLFCELGHNFSVIGITETGFKSTTPIINCHLEGFTFNHTPTESSKGGALLYISNKHNYFVWPDL